LKFLIGFGTRPEIIKLSPVIKELKRRRHEIYTVFSGQHYDREMAEIMLQEFNVDVDVNLKVGSDTDATQTSKALKGYEKEILDFDPDIVVVQGDTNTTLACSIASSKVEVPCAHIEAGLRSHDFTMPEEVNRVLVDHISSILFAPTEHSAQNLVSEGVSPRRIRVTGNTIVDVVNVKPEKKERKIVLTMHRHENVDSKVKMTEFFSILDQIKEEIIFPIHPRTEKRLKEYNLFDSIVSHKNLHIIAPVSHDEFQKLLARCMVTITDSGGVQEEASILKTVAITARKNTDRPEAVLAGINILTGINCRRIVNSVNDVFERWSFYEKRFRADIFGKRGASKKIAKVLERERIAPKSADYIEDGIPSLKLIEVDDALANRRIDEVRLDILQIFDRKGNMIFPKKGSFRLKKGYHLVVKSYLK